MTLTGDAKATSPVRNRGWDFPTLKWFSSVADPGYFAGIASHIHASNVSASNLTGAQDCCDIAKPLPA